MYYMPQLYNTEDFLCTVRTEEIDIYEQRALPAGPYQCD